MTERTRPGLTRVRDEAAPTDSRVLEVMRMMTAGEWRTGPSHVLLAEKYGVAESTVRNWATQASQLIRLSMGDGEEVRARLAGMLETLAGDAMKSDPRAATAAVKTLAELLGLITQKHEHAVVVAQYEQLPRAGKAQWLRDKAAALLAEAERLEAER